LIQADVALLHCLVTCPAAHHALTATGRHSQCASGEMDSAEGSGSLRIASRLPPPQNHDIHPSQNPLQSVTATMSAILILWTTSAIAAPHHRLQNLPCPPTTHHRPPLTNDKLSSLARSLAKGRKLGRKERKDPKIRQTKNTQPDFCLRHQIVATHNPSRANHDGRSRVG
jgi:hypothetical protein